MSTRSCISKVNEDKSITSVYCHSDGYPSWTGAILLEHYQDPKKIDQLLSGGDMSILGKDCNGAEGHSFNNKVEGQTVYYGRDRGEQGTEARNDKDQNEFEKTWAGAWCDYYYQWRDGKWFVGEAKNEIESELTLQMVADD